MINNKKVGIGIITYNRPQKFSRLIFSIKKLEFIDEIIIVKNKDEQYGIYDPKYFQNDKIKYFNILGDVGVGKCKNKALLTLLNDDCQYFFLIEDDIIIKDSNVFQKYIEMSQILKIHHFNFNMCYDKGQLIQPFYKQQLGDSGIQLTYKLCGAFSFFTRNCLINCGLMDDKIYINALQHCQHTYRISLQKYTSPFYAFVDILDSNKYLEDDGKESTINNKNQHRPLVALAYYNFQKKFGYKFSEIKAPTAENIKQYFLQLKEKREKKQLEKQPNN